MNMSIIGTGKIVHEALPVIAATEGIAVRSILAREHSLNKAVALAGRFGIPVVTTDYDAVLADAEVDTVYVALINSVHFDYALRALQADKHVILEKPACLRYSELLTLATEARRRGLMLFEAVTLLYLPAFHIVRDELLPLLGTVRHVECNYSQRSSRYDAYLRGEVLPAFDPAAGGGALMDINIYNLHFVMALFGPPQDACYYCRRGFNGVDLSGTVVMKKTPSPLTDPLPAPPQRGRVVTFQVLRPISKTFYSPPLRGSGEGVCEGGCERACEAFGDSSVYLCTGAKDSDAPSFGLVQGDRGWLRIEGPVSTMAGVTLCLRGEAPRAVPVPTVTHRLAPEFAAFADILARRDFAAMNRLLDHSLMVMQLVDAICHPIRD